MGDSVAEIRLLLQKLGSEKAKERKESLKSFPETLEKLNIQDALDRNTREEIHEQDGGQYCQTTWTEVIGCLVENVDYEIEHVKTKNLQLKRDISTSFRAILTKIISGPKGLRLFKACRKLVPHILKVLENEAGYTVFGGDYFEILIRVFNYCSDYFFLIRHDQMNDLTSLTIPHLLLARPPSSKVSSFVRDEKVVVSQALSLAIRMYEHSWTNEHLTWLLNFFADFFSSSANRADDLKTEHLLSSLNHILTHHALDFPNLVLTLSQKLHPFLRQLWSTRNKRLKDELVIYAQAMIRLQTSSYNRSTPEEATDLPRRARLMELFADIRRDLEESVSRPHSSTSKIGLTGRDPRPEIDDKTKALLSLATQVFYMVHQLDASRAEGVGVGVGEAETEGQPAKKRKVAAVKEQVLELLSLGPSWTHSHAVLPWLQFVAVYSRKDACLMPPPMLLAFASKVHAAVLSCEDRLPEPLYWAIFCLRRILKRCPASYLLPQPAASQQRSQSDPMSESEVWPELWRDLTVKLASPTFRPAAVDAAGLLASLVRLKLVSRTAVAEAQPSLWRSTLFQDPPSRSALLLLITLLCHSAIHPCSVPLGDSHLPIRAFLLAWVFGETQQRQGHLHTKFDPVRCSQAASLLMASAPTASSLCFKASGPSRVPGPLDHLAGWKDIIRHFPPTDHESSEKPVDHVEALRDDLETFLPKLFSSLGARQQSSSLSPPPSASRPAMSSRQAQPILVSQAIAALQAAQVAALLQSGPDPGGGLGGDRPAVRLGQSSWLHAQVVSLAARALQSAADALAALASDVLAVASLVKVLVDVLPVITLVLVGRDPSAVAEDAKLAVHDIISFLSSFLPAQCAALLEASPYCPQRATEPSPSRTPRPNGRAQATGVDAFDLDDDLSAGPAFSQPSQLSGRMTVVGQEREKSIQDALRSGIQFLEGIINNERSLILGASIASLANECLVAMSASLAVETVPLLGSIAVVKFEILRALGASCTASKRKAALGEVLVIRERKYFQHSEEVHLGTLRVILSIIKAEEAQQAPPDDRATDLIWTLLHRAHGHQPPSWCEACCAKKKDIPKTPLVPIARILLIDCLVAKLNFDPDAWTAAVDPLLSFLLDPDYTVRAHMVTAVRSLFSLWENQQEVYRGVLNALPPVALQPPSDSSGQSSAFEETALCTQAYIFTVSEPNQPAILYQFTLLQAGRPDLHELLDGLLQAVAVALGYPSSTDLARQHLRYLVGSWIHNGKGITEFPYRMLQVASADLFIGQAWAVIVPALVLRKDLESLITIFQSLQNIGFQPTSKPLSLKILADECFPQIFAYVLPVANNTDDRDARRALVGSIMTEFLPKCLGLGLEANQVKKHTDSIICALLQVLDPTSTDADPTTPVPAYSPDTIRQTLSDLADSHDAETVPKLLAKSEDRIYKVILELHKQLTDAQPRKSVQMQSFFALKFFIGVLGDNIIDWNTSRSLIHVLLQLMKYKHLRVDAANVLLDDVCLPCLKQKPELIMRNLNKIVSTLSSFITEAGAPDSQHSAPLVQALESLLSSPDLAKPEHFSALLPFPSSPAFKGLRERLQPSVETADLKTEIERFLLGIASQQQVGEAARMASLTHLHHLLASSQKELIQLGKRPEDATGTKGPEILPLLMAQLIEICAASDDPIFTLSKAKAAECLGELIGVDPYSITLPSMKSQTSPYGPVVPWGVPSNGNTDKLTLAKLVIISMLNGYLVDPDLKNVETAYQTLRLVLSTESGKAAYNCLAPEPRGELRPFLGRVKKRTDRHFQDPQRPPLDPEGHDTWNVKDKIYSSWIQDLTYSLLFYASNDEVLCLCGPMCASKAELAEYIFPLCILDIQRSGDPVWATTLSSKIDRHVLDDSVSNTECIRVVLSALDLLREQRRKALREIRAKTPKNGPAAWSTEYWLDLDYRRVARAAQRCSAYLTSLLYIELWCEKTFGRLWLGDDRDVEPFAEAGEHEKLLLKVYSRINEPDGLFGVNRHRDLNSQLATYEHNRDWQSSLAVYDIMLQGNIPTSSTQSAHLDEGVLSSLQQLGLLHTMDYYFRGFASARPGDTGLLADRQFEAAWRSFRCGSEEVAPQLLLTESRGFHSRLHAALIALRQGSHDLFLDRLEAARLQVGRDLAQTSVESTKAVYPLITRLHMLAVLQSSWQICWPSGAPDLQSSGRRHPQTSDDNRLAQFLSHLEERIEGMQWSYELLEPLTSLRGSLLGIFGRGDCLQQHWQQVANFARKHHAISSATSAIYHLKLTSHASRDVSWLLDEAQVLKARGDLDGAMSVCRSLVRAFKRPNTSAQARLAAEAYCLSAKCAAKTRSDSAAVIEESLLSAVDLAKEDPAILSKIHFRLAHFLDQERRILVEKMKSADWQSAKELRRLKEEEVSTMEAVNRTEFQRFIAAIRKELARDEEEIQKNNARIEEYLLGATRSYIQCLAGSDSKYDLRAVFRLCALWFNNLSNDDLSDSILGAVNLIPSHKFLPLIYQIASRLGTKVGRAAECIESLVSKMAYEHPYHTLYPLFALANGDNVPKEQSNREHHVVDKDKIEAAKRIIKSLEGQKDMQDLIRQLKDLVVAYMDLAYYENKKAKGPEYEMPAKIRDLAGKLWLVPVPTADIPVDPSGRYENLDMVRSFSGKYSLAGGLNNPKIIQCEGTHGSEYKQLVKGKDDLRQDAVMQQIFGMLNVLLAQTGETQRRKLRIRTYKVIPLSPGSGLLEWVMNTIPIGEYLVGRTTEQWELSAHARYDPDGMLHTAARQMMNDGKDEKDRLNRFANVCAHFRPVFHNFFLEYFVVPSEWFVRRLAYTRSVATSSMVGYIVGLGDRHAQNILVDKVTAELVHIDFGVAFEQGKTLRIPEIVPFRLTRDMVDGMGVTGIEGVFRRSCEETMRVLRAHKESLLTIIDVFIHDPLYKWALSPLKALKLQRYESPLSDEVASSKSSRRSASPPTGSPTGASVSPTLGQNSGNKDAERALIRVREKLQGYESGEGLSVEGQVKLLLNQARSPDFLSAMYCGWSPWL